MNILITGSQGYIGSVLAPYLQTQGHLVSGIDTGFFASEALYPLDRPLVSTLPLDIRQLHPSDLAGFDAIVHLAELANDPLGELLPEITQEINYKATLRLAQLAKQAGVKRFIYSSSCSVYGISKDAIVDEDSAINPLTTYAHCKVAVEKDLQKLADKTFSPTILRNATVFGASPHMRFDLVLNNLCGVAWTQHKIVLTSDGSPWRPLVHVLDVCQAIQCVLQADPKVVHNQVLNVGSNENNATVKDIATTVATVFPQCQIQLGKTSSDQRSYRVCFDKIQHVLPKFTPKWSIEMGAQALKECFEDVELTPEQFESRHFTRLKQLQYLLQSEQLNAELFWKPEASSAFALPF